MKTGLEVKSATPLVAVMDKVPVSAPVPALKLSVMTDEAAAPSVMVFPLASCTSTIGAIILPAKVSIGDLVKANCDAALEVILNVLLTLCV